MITVQRNNIVLGDSVISESPISIDVNKVDSTEKENQEDQKDIKENKEGNSNLEEENNSQ